MGKVMKKIGGLVSKISKIVSPILSIAKMIPGIGQIASAVDAGMKIIGNIGKIMEKGFPKGLLEVAKMAVTSFLPGPLGKIAEFASGKLNMIKDLIPAGVKQFIPMNILPVPKGIGDLLAG